VVCLVEKQEVTLARRVDNGITLLDWRDVSRSEVTDHPKWQVDLIKAANEVPFLITCQRTAGAKKEKATEA
jgi:hypothetical protein